MACLLLINNFGPSLLKNDTKTPSQTLRSSAVKCCKCNYFAQPTFHDMYKAGSGQKWFLFYEDEPTA